MWTDMLYVLLVLVVFHLVAVGVALVLFGLYELARAARSALVRCWSEGRSARITTQRIAEIRSRGQQARREMEQLSFAYLYTVSHRKRR